MKRILLLATIFTVTSWLCAQNNSMAKVYLYNTDPSGGMRIAATNTNGNLDEIGQIFSSDYGPWGSGKKMYAPSVTRLANGRTVAVFQVDETSPCFAVTCSDDMHTWRPQDYPRMSVGGCFAPIVEPRNGGGVTVYFKTKDGKVRMTYSDADIRHFSPDVEVSATNYVPTPAVSAEIGGKTTNGIWIDIPEAQLAELRDYFNLQQENAQRWRESLADDNSTILPQLPKTAKALLRIDINNTKPISDKLIGVFFEDISYAADGGLYAELVQNRDFEYSSSDRREWNSSTAWSVDGGTTLLIATDKPLSANNPHYAILNGKALTNTGWDGTVVNEGDVFNFSIFVNNISRKANSLKVELVADGRTIASTSLKLDKKDGWKQLEASMKACGSATNAQLRITPTKKGRLAIDMVSLFPENTFMHRKNGLRADMAQAIADLKPKFIRFPGGCMSHGQGLDNIYHWHHTVGELYDRVPDRNIWGYHQTRGLGFFEYFQFCEDIGAEPLPVLAAGVPCQNSEPDASGYAGQQGGIDMNDMPAYIQEFLDLIEWANGDPATSRWARMRADAGHPQPFNLKYIGVGNEDLISTVFEERYLMIAKAIKERYPEIEICGTAGPFHAPSSDYIEGWRFANEHRNIFSIIDEHYYESVGWFLNNQHYYDDYDRKGPKVYLGEYAASIRGTNGIDCALAEAVHLCNIERNADVVTMTSYAPLFSKNGHSNWSPDMMYFSNNDIVKSPSYEAQRLFSVYGGNEYIASRLEADSIVAHRVATSVVRNSATGETFLKVVNVLPVSLELTLSTPQMPIAQQLPFEGFSGTPGSHNANLEHGTYSVRQDDSLTISLPPYSMRAIRLK